MADSSLGEEDRSAEIGARGKPSSQGSSSARVAAAA